MKQSVRTHLTPALLEPADLAGAIAVVIDVLRATTTIAYALAAGAARVIPCLEVDEAQQVAAGLSNGNALLGGERGGVKIAGFDLGNSPAEYTPRRVGGKTVVFTTTNGTRALQRSSAARRVVTGSFANLNAVVHWLSKQLYPVHIVCAGTEGRITLEDVLCAGAIACGLTQATGELDLSDDGTALAVNLFETRATDYDRFLETLRDSRGGRHLIDLGFESDVDLAARWDVTPVVPEISGNPWQILAATDAGPPGRRYLEPPRALRV